MEEIILKSVALYTLGCKVNQYETDAMIELFKEDGYAIKPFNEPADIYVINTCTVTNMADRKSRKMLHRAKKQNQESLVVAVGCYVQAAREKIEEDVYVDLIIGNNKKKDIVKIINNYLDKNKLEDNIIDIHHTKEYEALKISCLSEHTRACIKIQDGCNQFCSYCIIPYTRGRVRSRAARDIMSEVENLVVHGYKEIVLTGIHISSYGLDFQGKEYNTSLDKDTDKKNDEHFILLIERLSSIDGLERIRLGSLEPRIITEAFVKRLAVIPQICPHFHLSLQSGCDETLKRMNRRYDTKDYKICCDILRKYFDNPAITTDIIVGFPGETDKEFEMTKAYLSEIGFAAVHVFPYSKRAGTKAADMKEQVTDAQKGIRSRELLEKVKMLRERYFSQYLNKTVEILIEETIELEGRKYDIGHSKEYIKVALEYVPNRVNTMVSGRIKHKIHEDLVFCESIH